MSTKDSGRGYKYTGSIWAIVCVKVWIFASCCYKKHYEWKLKLEQEMKAAFLIMKSVAQELCKSKQVHPSHWKMCFRFAALLFTSNEMALFYKV